MNSRGWGGLGFTPRRLVDKPRAEPAPTLVPCPADMLSSQEVRPERMQTRRQRARNAIRNYLQKARSPRLPGSCDTEPPLPRHVAGGQDIPLLFRTNIPLHRVLAPAAAPRTAHAQPPFGASSRRGRPPTRVARHTRCYSPLIRLSCETPAKGGLTLLIWAAFCGV